MTPRDARPNVIELDLGRRDGPSQGPEQIVGDFIAVFEKLNQKGRQLESANAELRESLKEANERLARYERSAPTVAHLTKFAVKTAAQMLEQAAQSIRAAREQTQEQNAARVEDAKKQALDLQAEAFALLEATQDQGSLRLAETDKKVVDVLQKTRESILSIAADLEERASDLGASAAAPAGPAWDEPALGSQTEPPEQTSASAFHSSHGRPFAGAGTPATGGTPGGNAAQDGVAQLEELLRRLSATLAPAAPTVPPRSQPPSQAAPNGSGQYFGGPYYVPPYGPPPMYGYAPAYGPPAGYGVPPVYGPVPAYGAVSPYGQAPAVQFGGYAQPAPQEPRAAFGGYGVPTAQEPSFGGYAQPNPPAAQPGPVNSLKITVAPFRTFAALSGFLRAIKRLPGAVDAKVHSFEKDVLRVELFYSGPTAPVSPLLALAEFGPRLVSVQGDKLEIAVSG